ncbi:AraC family transcriptional regulator [Caulobacter vibrioides]|uniref:AraC family transcriptional regulator n=1 Tax=Caulobacter vibrioides TaxID=155892 RepID=UPI0013DDA9FB|nr:AraC family transcriptional regulator [Caulobacter vibrioides]
MNQDVANNYHARMRRVLDHIDAHLDEDLSVEVLAAVAAFSRHHFQRQFSGLYGIGVAAYVQLARMKRASYRLAFRERDGVLGIALDSGYEGPEAFSRAFRRLFEQSPSSFRRAPRWEPWHAAQSPLVQARRQTMTFTDDDVRIVDFPDTPVAVMRHEGDPALLGDTIRRFIAWRRAAGLPPRVSATFNVFHDDPDDTPAEQYRLDLCAATARVASNPDGVTSGVIPGGPCAVLRQIGSSDDLRAASRFLYGEWLPRSGREPRDAPFFAQRVSFFPDVPEHEAVTDLFLPLSPRT